MVEQGAGAHTVIRRVASAVLSVAPERIDGALCRYSEAPLDPALAARASPCHRPGHARRSRAHEADAADLAAKAYGWPSDGVRLEGDRFVSGAESATFDEVALRIGLGQCGRQLRGRGRMATTSRATSTPRSTASRSRSIANGRGARRRCGPGGRRRAQSSTRSAHQGQLEGGFAFGLGAGADGRPGGERRPGDHAHAGRLQAAHGMDMPPLRTVLLETEVGPGPFGAKAVGEVTNSGVAPAIANAVANAVGARVCELPLSAERVLDSDEAQVTCPLGGQRDRPPGRVAAYWPTTVQVWDAGERFKRAVRRPSAQTLV